jgi:hypothetical protein
MFVLCKNDVMSQSQSHFTTDSWSVNQSVDQSVLVLSPCGTHDQILAVVKTVELMILVVTYFINSETK